jgi:hypothetical protein
VTPEQEEQELFKLEDEHCKLWLSARKIEQQLCATLTECEQWKLKIKFEQDKIAMLKTYAKVLIND